MAGCFQLSPKHSFDEPNHLQESFTKWGSCPNRTSHTGHTIHPGRIQRPYQKFRTRPLVLGWPHLSSGSPFMTASIPVHPVQRPTRRSAAFAWAWNALSYFIGRIRIHLKSVRTGKAFNQWRACQWAMARSSTCSLQCVHAHLLDVNMWKINVSTRTNHEICVTETREKYFILSGSSTFRTRGRWGNKPLPPMEKPLAWKWPRWAL